MAVAITAAFGAVVGAGALSARGSKPFAYALFADGNGTRATSPTSGWRLAQAGVIRFNMLAAGAG